MRRKVDREEIIEKGLDLMSLYGYQATGVKEIADAVGMLKGSFYNYFPSKEQFAKTLMETYHEKNLELIHTILSDKSQSPVNRIKTLYNTFWEGISKKHNYTKGCFIGNCSQELGDTNPFLRTVIDNAMNRTYALIAACLREAIAIGEIDKTQNPEVLSEFINNSWQGVLVRSKSSKNELAMNGFREQIFNRLLK